MQRGIIPLKIIENDDKERVAHIRALLKTTGGYCPCAIIKDKTTKCPCQDFRAQTTPGLCHCGLYQKVEE